MKMKKACALLLTGLMTLSVTACGSKADTIQNTSVANTTESTVSETTESADVAVEEEAPGSLVIEHALGTTEVPYCPERVCVLDSNIMDFIHVLDLGEYVASVQSPKGIPAYLEEYYNSDSIIVLERMESENKKSKSAESTEATESTKAADPYEGYYSIDADLILGTADTVNEELYEVLSQIAPTVVTDFAIDHEDGMYAGVKANARMIASIWGVEDKLDEAVAEYDAIYEELDEALEGVSVVMVNSTMDSNRIQIVSNDDYESDSEKLECERSGRMLLDLGMVMYSNDAPEEVAQASVYERNGEASAQSTKNQVIADWIEQMDPEYVLLVDRNFDSIEEAKAEGYEITELTGLTAYQEGSMYMLSYEGKTGSSGLYGTFIQLNELKEIFLNK